MGRCCQALTIQIPSRTTKSKWYSSWISQDTKAAFRHSQLGLHFSQFLRHQEPHADAPTALKLDTHFPLMPYNTVKQAKALPSHQTEGEHLLPASHCSRVCCNTDKKHERQRSCPCPAMSQTPAVSQSNTWPDIHTSSPTQHPQEPLVV